MEPANTIHAEFPHLRMLGAVRDGRSGSSAPRMQDASEAAVVPERKRPRGEDDEQHCDSRVARMRMQRVRELHAQGRPIQIKEPQATLPLYNLHEYAYRPFIPPRHTGDLAHLLPEVLQQQRIREQIRAESAARVHAAHIEAAAAAFNVNLQSSSVRDGVAASRSSSARRTPHEQWYEHVLHQPLNQHDTERAPPRLPYAVPTNPEARARQLYENGLAPFEHELQQRRIAMLVESSLEHLQQQQQQQQQQHSQQSEPPLPRQHDPQPREPLLHHHAPQQPQRRDRSNAVPPVLAGQSPGNVPRRTNRTSAIGMRNRHVHISEGPHATHTFVHVEPDRFVPSSPGLSAGTMSPQSRLEWQQAERSQRADDPTAHRGRQDYLEAIQQEERDFLEAQSQSLDEYSRACGKKPLSAMVMAKLCLREAHAGFTHSVVERVVCVSCNTQLHRSVWFLRQCGHVYCQDCAARDSAARKARCSAKHCGATAVGVYREVFF